MSITHEVSFMTEIPCQNFVSIALLLSAIWPFAHVNYIKQQIRRC